MGSAHHALKTAAWCISAFFLGLTGGAVGNMLGSSIRGSRLRELDVRRLDGADGDPGREGDALGAGDRRGRLPRHKELFWTYLLGWQRVALGLLIVVIVVFFPVGILGWARERWPERFGDAEARRPRVFILEVDRVRKAFGGLVANKNVTLRVPRGRSRPHRPTARGRRRCSIRSSAIIRSTADPSASRAGRSRGCAYPRSPARPAAYLPADADLRRDDLPAEPAHQRTAAQSWAGDRCSAAVRPRTSAGQRSCSTSSGSTPSAICVPATFPSVSRSSSSWPWP